MALDVVDQLVRSSAVDVVVVDSVAGMYSSTHCVCNSCGRSEESDSVHRPLRTYVH
jgi:RecA/RadA recombinase